MPWVHVADLARLYVHAAETSAIAGPMNAVAPNPVRNREFTKALANAVHRPAFMPAPYLGLRLVFGSLPRSCLPRSGFSPRLPSKAVLSSSTPRLPRPCRTSSLRVADACGLSHCHHLQGADSMPDRLL